MNKFILWLVLALSALHAGAQSIDGTWVFDKAVDYEGLTSSSSSPLTSTLQISNAQVILTAGCIVNLRQEGYYPGGPFQSLLKSGEDESKIGKFLLKHFNFNLIGVKIYYVADIGAKCNRLGIYFLADADKLISIHGGSLFYAFKREKSETGAVATQGINIDLGNLKVSRLPFNPHTYVANCLGFMQKRQGAAPQMSKKCDSAFSPYIVGRNTKDPLLKLIGAHAFVKGGARGALDDYDNPVANNLHPVVLVFPRLKNVVLVRVEDIEGSDDTRDQMSGVYLAIKDGKVTDQLNEGCGFDLDFVCSSPSQTIKYKLLETGKFARQN
jgi:hypothetical protein